MNLFSEISSINGCYLFLDQDLTKFTTMRLQSHGDLVEIKSITSLQKLLPLLKKHQKNYIVVGWGANQILPHKCKDLVIHLDFDFDTNYLNQQRDEYDLPASLGLNHLTHHALKFGLSGWDFFTGIPASLGGAIYMNAGTNLGEIGSLLKKVRIVTPEGQLREEIINSLSFSYRKNHFIKSGEVIVSAVISHKGIDPEIPDKIKDYLEYRKKTQPLSSKNCGCVFKNPKRELQAGRLIDLLGLKELSLGDLRVSPKHGNFIENLGGGNWDQFQSILKVIKSNIDHFYGIEFELEVKISYD
jgi:UDP-N-acetylmuramate dehydrogenase